MQRYGYIAVIAIMGLLMVLQQCNGGQTTINPGAGKIDTIYKEVVRIDTFERVVRVPVARHIKVPVTDTLVLRTIDTLTLVERVLPDSVWFVSDTIYWTADTDTIATLDYQIVALGEVLSFAPIMEVPRRADRVREVRQVVRPTIEIAPVIGATALPGRTLFARGVSASYKQFGASYLRHGAEGSSYLIHYKIQF